MPSRSHNLAPAGRVETGRPFQNNLFQILIMTSQTRDSLALYCIATIAIVVVLYADADLGQLFTALLGLW